MTPRILVAEDDDLQSEVLRAALEGRGYEVEVVGDGLRAVHRLRTGNFHIGLLDYHLPNLNGLHAAQELQSLFREVDRPRLIAFTVAANELRDREANLGGLTFNAVVPKAQGLDTLLAVIGANLKLVEVERSAWASAQGAGLAQHWRYLLPVALLVAATIAVWAQL
jgi:CheY-like chemotaxis protein